MHDDRADDADGDAGSGSPPDANGASHGDAGGDVLDPDAVLDAVGFDPERSVLTRRQAEVLALRERGARQQDVADLLGTSRANVSSVEASARDNVANARETVAFADALSAPVRVVVDPDTDLYDVPKEVYDACDEAGVKVNYTAPELMKVVSDAADDAVRGRKVHAALLVGVSHDGTVRVRRQV